MIHSYEVMVISHIQLASRLRTYVSTFYINIFHQNAFILCWNIGPDILNIFLYMFSSGISQQMNKWSPVSTTNYRIYSRGKYSARGCSMVDAVAFNIGLEGWSHTSHLMRVQVARFHSSYVYNVARVDIGAFVCTSCEDRYGFIHTLTARGGLKVDIWYSSAYF